MISDFPHFRSWSKIRDALLRLACQTLFHCAAPTRWIGSPGIDEDMMKRLLITSPKGGSGKTNLSRNLAVAAALAGLKVATIDLDPQRTLSKWHSRRGADLVNFPNYEADMPDASELIADEILADCNLVLFDTPPSIDSNPAAIKALIMAADLVLIPARPTIDDAESAVPMMRMVRSYRRKAAFVLNAIIPRADVNDIKLLLTRTGTVCQFEITNRVDFARAAQQGMALPEVPKHTGAAEVMGVWEFARGELWGHDE
jgi:chromosome partitioning protein